MRFFCLIVLLLFLAACSPQQSEIQQTESAAKEIGLNGERFHVEIGGAAQTEITPGFAQFWKMPALDEFQLLLYDGDSRYRLALNFPQHAAAGIMPLDSTGTVKAALAGPDNVADFTAASGTLTLETVGERYSGRFELNLNHSDGRQITVKGSFQDVVRTD